jgi:hypothetical protein
MHHGSERGFSAAATGGTVETLDAQEADENARHRERSERRRRRSPESMRFAKTGSPTLYRWIREAGLRTAEPAIDGEITQIESKKETSAHQSR